MKDNDLLQKIIGGPLVFIVGINFVGFGMHANGSDYRGNPAWELLRPFFVAEYYIFICVVVIAIIFGIYSMVTFALAPVNEEEVKLLNFIEAATHHKSARNDPPEKSESATTSIADSHNDEFSETSDAIAKAITQPEPKPAPPPPDPQELKKKALKQITRGF